MNTRQFSKGVKAAVSSLKTTLSQSRVPSRYSAAKKRIVCKHCGSDGFFNPQLLNLAGNVTVGKYLAGVNCLECTNCGCLELFSSTPSVDDQDS